MDDKQSWYCPMPFKYLHVEHDGVAPCCRMNRVPMTIEEYLSSDHLRNIQEQFLANEKPLGCQLCIDEENKFGQSLRTQSIRDYQNNLFATTDIDSIDYRASNVCNFKCRMCNPNYSHSINQEAQQNPLTVGMLYAKIYPQKKITAKQDDYDWMVKNIDKIKRFMFAGGEPTYMPEVKVVVEKIKESGRLDLQINMTSNCSFKDPIWYTITETIPNVHWTASIDAVGNDAELIRHGTDWPVIEKNVRWLAGHSSSLDIHSVITNLNIFRLKPLLRFVREIQKISKWPTSRHGSEGARHLITVITDKGHPSQMAANNWPDDIKPRIIDYIDDCAALDLDQYQREQLISLRDLIKHTPFNYKLWDKTRNFHDTLDLVRKENHEFLHQPAD